jgi:hypothetical protein
MKRTLLVVLISLSISVSAAAQGSRRKQTLQGLHGLRVVVETLNPELERDGLATSQIQVDIELRLRKAGITVFSQGEANRSDGPAVLHVMVDAVKGDDFLQNLYAVHTSVELWQVVYLHRLEKSPAFAAATWTIRGTALVGKEKLDDVRSYLAGQVNEFINDYLTANSK